jgi:exonuclease III
MQRSILIGSKKGAYRTIFLNRNSYYTSKSKKLLRRIFIMEAFEIAKQMIDLQKTTFQNTFTALAMLQEQTEKMATAFLDQIPGLSKEGRKTINEWVGAFKKARDDFKKAVDC